MISEPSEVTRIQCADGDMVIRKALVGMRNSSAWDGLHYIVEPVYEQITTWESGEFVRFKKIGDCVCHLYPPYAAPCDVCHGTHEVRVKID
jgi:hypothetical protein